MVKLRQDHNNDWANLHASDWRSLQKSCLTASRSALLNLTAAVLLIAPVKAQSSAGASATTEIGNGIRLMSSGRLTEAKLKFATAVKINPNSADAFTWKGICENRLQQYHEASQDLRTALRIDPQAQSAHYNLALAEIKLGQTDKAVSDLKIFLLEHPEAIEAQYDLAVLLETKHSLAEAVTHLKTAYQLQPDDSGIAQHLLVDELALDQSEDMQSILDRLRGERISPQAQLLLATALLESKHFPEAAALIESARLQLPHSTKQDLLLARAYIGADQDFEAIKLLKGSEHEDTSGDTAYLLGLAYSGAGATQEAAEAFQTAANANPRDAKPLFHLGMIYSAIPEQKARGWHDLREAVRLDPPNANYSIALAKLLLENDRSKDALEILEHTRADDAQAAERELLLGIAQVTINGVSIAVPTLERAVELDPSIALSHNVLGFCYFKEGNYVQAAKAYQRASDLQPATLIFAYDAALAFERSSNISEAIVYAERAAALPSARADDHSLLGKLYAQSGRKEEAIRELKVAVQMNPDLDDSYYLLARTYMQLGDATQASDWNSKLTALKQKHDAAYAAQKTTQPGESTSSSLLHGASLTAEESKDQKR